MGSRFNKSLLVILSVSCLLLSANAVPSTRGFNYISTRFPAASHKSHIDYISTRFPAASHKSHIDYISTSIPAAGHKSRVIDYISASVPAVAPSSRHIEFKSVSVPAAAPSSRKVVLDQASQSGVAMLGNIASRAAEQAYPEIIHLCIDGENVALCVETILKQMTGPFDPLKALEITVDATLVQAETIANTIQKLQKDPSTDKRAIDALEVCHEEYGDMLDTIKEAVELIQLQNVVDAYYRFSAVLSYKSTCDDAFVESPGVVMPFFLESQTLFQLGGNCLGIMNEIVNHVRI